MSWCHLSSLDRVGMNAQNCVESVKPDYLGEKGSSLILFSDLPSNAELTLLLDRLQFLCQIWELLTMFQCISFTILEPSHHHIWCKGTGRKVSMLQKSQLTP